MPANGTDQASLRAVQGGSPTTRGQNERAQRNTRASAPNTSYNASQGSNNMYSQYAGQGYSPWGMNPAMGQYGNQQQNLGRYQPPGYGSNQGQGGYAYNLPNAYGGTGLNYMSGFGQLANVFNPFIGNQAPNGWAQGTQGGNPQDNRGQQMQQLGQQGGGQGMFSGMNRGLGGQQGYWGGGAGGFGQQQGPNRGMFGNMGGGQAMPMDARVLDDGTTVDRNDPRFFSPSGSGGVDSNMNPAAIPGRSNLASSFGNQQPPPQRMGNGGDWRSFLSQQGGVQGMFSGMNRGLGGQSSLPQVDNYALRVNDAPGVGGSSMGQTIVPGRSNAAGGETVIPPRSNLAFGDNRTDFRSFLDNQMNNPTRTNTAGTQSRSTFGRWGGW